MEEIIKIFNDHHVRYLLIGGQAVRLEGMPRFSMDWDFYIPSRDQENIKKINHLLENDLDLPLVPLGPHGENFVQTDQTRWGILQFHLSGLSLPKFDEAENRAVIHKTDNGTGTPIRCVSGHDLLESKKVANRPEDQGDIRFLEKKKELGRLK